MSKHPTPEYRELQEKLAHIETVLDKLQKHHQDGRVSEHTWLNHSSKVIHDLKTIAVDAVVLTALFTGGQTVKSEVTASLTPQITQQDQQQPKPLSQTEHSDPAGANFIRFLEERKHIVHGITQVENREDLENLLKEYREVKPVPVRTLDPR